IAALQRWRDAGRKLVLVTGENARQLHEFPHAKLFDRIVGENGAILLHSSSGKSMRGKERKLCQPPPARLVRALKRAHVWPLRRGHRILQAKFEHEGEIEKVLRQLKSDWRIVRDRRELMVLPAGVTKASGVVAALKDLGLSPRQAIAVGDAENDGPLLDVCGLAVAVRNAVPALKRKSDRVTRGNY